MCPGTRQNGTGMEGVRRPGGPLRLTKCTSDHSDLDAPVGEGGGGGGGTQNH